MRIFDTLVRIIAEHHGTIVPMLAFGMIGAVAGSYICNSCPAPDWIRHFMLFAGLVYGLSEGRRIYCDMFRKE